MLSAAMIYLFLSIFFFCSFLHEASFKRFSLSLVEVNSHTSAHLGYVVNPRCQEAGVTERAAVTRITRLSTPFLFTVRTLAEAC